jgi:uncharacterized membrane protein
MNGIHQHQRQQGKLGPAIAVVATGALACGVCCVLPFALPPALLALSGGMLAWFASAYSLVTYLATVAVVGGWMWVMLQSLRTKKRPARTTVVTMAVATVILLLALVWPKIEGLIVSTLVP